MPPSRKASQAGLDLIKEALERKGWNAEDLANQAEIGRSTAYSFCEGTKIRHENFVRFCTELNLDWEVVAGLKPIDRKVSESQQGEPIDLDALVQSARSRLHEDVKKRCGWMKVLNMTYPIESSAIYTDVNLLDTPLHLRSFRELERSLPEFNAKDSNRLWLGQAVENQRRDGIEMVQQTKLLMILGAPGVGKSTFLKRLAMLCYGDDALYFHNLVPFFVRLKEFAEAEGQPNLLDYLARLSNAAVDAETIATLLQGNRGLLLLDGLDEVMERDRDRVIDQIRTFADTYDQNHIVITCRIAAREYTFTRFTDVEIASFNKEQIADFAHKWFCAKGDGETAEAFLAALEERQPIKELATNPLLLTLLCLEFENDLAFPSSRAELYERGLEVLFTRWDTSRKIRREEVYKKLPVKRKKELLGQLAYETFDRSEYFFKQRVAEEQISRYIANLPDAQTDPEALLVDSHAVLKSIESQHGLLTERASSIYAFSHLTFQEYFTAKRIVDAQDPQQEIDRLLDHLYKPRWREVFLLVVEQLRNADYFLEQMKKRIDEFLSTDESLQQFLVWVQEKSKEVETSYKPAQVRFFYFSLACEHPRDRDRDFKLALGLDLNMDIALYRALERARALEKVEVGHVRSCTYALDVAYALISNIEFILNIAEGELRQKLQKLRDELLASSWQTYDHLKQWWGVNGEQWTDRLRQVMIDRRIGHDWQFTKEQKQKLEQYSKSNKLLVDCLNSENCVSRSVREEIESTLLLPMS